jgi:hypothetical protein
MKLGEFLDKKDILGDKYEQYESLKKKLEKEGLPPHLATYKALEILTPDKLEKIKMLSKKRDLSPYSIVFFFKDEEAIKLVSKYFRITLSEEETQVGHTELLLELLKLLDKEK